MVVDLEGWVIRAKNPSGQVVFWTVPGPPKDPLKDAHRWVDQERNARWFLNRDLADLYADKLKEVFLGFSEIEVVTLL